MKTLELPPATARCPRRTPLDRQLTDIGCYMTDLYSWGVTCTRRSEDLGQIATTWTHLVRVFGSFVTMAQALADQKSSPAAWRLVELAEQYRHAASVRYQQVAEELQCAKQPLPKGLLPLIR